MTAKLTIENVDATRAGGASLTASDWLEAVRTQVNSLRFGVVQRVVVLACFASSTVAADPAPATEQLIKRIDELEQKVKILERNRELDADEKETKLKTAPQITIDGRGFAFASPDKNFALKLRGVLQIDSRTFLHDHGIAANDGFFIRRARPIVEGTVFRDFDFLFVPDFGGSSPQIFDAYLNWRIRPALQLRAGKFKSPVGLEQLVVDVDTLFNERALPTSLTPNRDIGFLLHGEVLDGRVSYAAGLFNGSGDARNIGMADTDDNKEFAGRIFFQPFKQSSAEFLRGVGFGVGGSYGNEHGTGALPATTGGTLAGYATDGQQQFFAYNPSTGAVTADGAHWRISPQGYYYNGPVGFLGEYVISNQRVTRTGTAPLTSARIENTGWQITGSWILTGETAAYRGGVTPEKSFSFSSSGWGAWQLVARYAELHIDADAFPNFANPSTSASAAHSWGVGLNWYLNRNIQLKTSFARTTFDGGGGAGTTAPAAVTRQPENVLFTRVQLSF